MGYVSNFQDGETFERETLAMLKPAGPYQTQFGAVPYSQRHEPQTRKHEWLIKGVLTRGEQGMLVGHSQTGKSFLAMDLSMAVARGVPWFDLKVRQGLVIYLAGESARGVRDKRLPAYDRRHGLESNHELPFVLLTLPIDLYSSDDDVGKLIVECEHWQKVYADFPLELVVVDTFAASTPGADENSGKDVGSIRRRLKRLEMALNTAVLLVHHKNASGTKARGHSSMFADVENVLDISMVQREVGKDAYVVKDANGRKVREAVVAKVKDGEDGKTFRFVLEGVKLGVDEDGDSITSCVIAPPDMGRTEPAEHERTGGNRQPLPNALYLLLKAISEAVGVDGVAPERAGVRLPNTFTVVNKKVASQVFKARSHELEPPLEGTAEEIEAARTKADDKFRQAWKRGCEALDARGYIKSEGNWIWRTGKLMPGEVNTPHRAADDDAPVTENDWISEE